MNRRLAVSLLVLVPALVAVVGFAADSGLLSFNQPRGAMPRVETSEPTTGGFTSENVEYEGFSSVFRARISSCRATRRS